MTHDMLSDPALLRAWAVEQAVARRDLSNDLIEQAGAIVAFVSKADAEPAPFGYNMYGQPCTHADVWKANHSMQQFAAGGISPANWGAKV